MSTWLTADATEDDLLAQLRTLAPKLQGLRSHAAAECPGRTADLIRARAVQLVTGTGSLDEFGPLDAAEQAVIALTEQFLVDVHGIDDAMFASLGEHYAPGEQIAIMFQMAFADGFSKFRRIFGVD